MYQNCSTETWSFYCMKLNSTLKKWLYNKYTANIPDKLSLLLKEQGVPDEWILPSTIIIHKLSNMPWYTQDELLRDTKLSKEDLIELNSIIRNSDILQDVILNDLRF